MDGLLRELCGLSILCGAALSIAPEGAVKRVLEILCSAALLTALLTPLKGIDLESYALQLAKYKEDEAALTAKGDEMNNRLNRLVIEGECNSYIMDKAKEKGVDVKEAEVELKWSTEGLWYPYSARIVSNAEGAEKAALIDALKSELGIPEERVTWSGYE